MNCCIDWQRFFNCLLEIFCCLHSRFFSICYSCLAEVFCLLGQHYSRIMKGPARFVFVLLVEIYLCSLCDCILLGKEEDQYLKQVVKEFERMGSMIVSSKVRIYARCMLIPKLFIWCPLRHNGQTVKCPVHGCPLQAGHWTDVLDGSSATPRNPRLVYDLGGNVLLVQCFYNCKYSSTGHKKTGHSYLSGSNDILGILPCDVRSTFPILLQQRSGFTKRIYDYLITGLYQGQNFMELAEGIASIIAQITPVRRFQNWPGARYCNHELCIICMELQTKG